MSITLEHLWQTFVSVSFEMKQLKVFHSGKSEGPLVQKDPCEIYISVSGKAGEIILKCQIQLQRSYLRSAF